MSVLLRQPGSVPARFSRASDDEAVARAASTWQALRRNVPLLAVASWTGVLLLDYPVVKCAMAVASLALKG